MFKDYDSLKKEYNDQLGVHDLGYHVMNTSTKTSLSIKEKLNDIFEDIDIQVNSWRSSIKGFFIGLYNFWKFRKIIFRDRFWDYSFLVEMIVFKLKDMEDNWVKNTHYEGDKFTKGRITVLRKRIESLEENIQEIEERYMSYFSTHEVTDEERLRIYKSMRKEIQILTDEAYKTLGRNIRKFWD